MNKVKAWFWWWFGLDTVTRNYIRYKQPNAGLLMRYLTREETLFIPWGRLDEIEIPKNTTRSMLLECLAWYQESMDSSEMNYYASRIGLEYMYRLYLLRTQEMQEAHDAWLASFKKLRETVSKPIV